MHVKRPPADSTEGLTRVFITDEVETHALSDISLSIDRGEYVAIAGPSGCGKSTLLSILGLLDTPTSGTDRLDGNLVSDISRFPSARAFAAGRSVSFFRAST